MPGVAPSQPRTMPARSRVSSRSLHGFRSPKMNENNWRYWYKAAVLELNSSLVQIRVSEALAAINARAAAGTRVPRDELRDMRAAMSTLREMKSRQEVTRAPLMASWLLDCKNCSKPFVYSLIAD